MVYSELISTKHLMGLNGKMIWYARISDHPKYSFEHEILDVPVSHLVRLPQKCLFSLGKEFLLATEATSVACQIMYLDGDEELSYVKRSDDEYILLNDNSYIADTKEELIEDIVGDLVEVIHHCAEQREYSRVKWYFSILQIFDPELVYSMSEKSPELFI